MKVLLKGVQVMGNVQVICSCLFKRAAGVKAVGYQYPV